MDHTNNTFREKLFPVFSFRLTSTPDTFPSSINFINGFVCCSYCIRFFHMFAMPSGCNLSYLCCDRPLSNRTELLYCLYRVAPSRLTHFKWSQIIHGNREKFAKPSINTSKYAIYYPQITSLFSENYNRHYIYIKHQWH